MEHSLECLIGLFNRTLFKEKTEKYIVIQNENPKCCHVQDLFCLIWMSYNEFEKESATNNESKLLKTFSVLAVKGIASQMCFDEINEIK